jgi:nucleoside phosphorylase
MTYAGPSAPLPRADIAVLTWTSAEWSALDQVFLDSTTERFPASRDFERSWDTFVYSRDVGSDATDNQTNPLWGYYRLAKVPTVGGNQLTALLFKCGAHLAHPPWIEGLSQMVSQIITDAQPSVLYSIGTAGGTRPDVRLGDVVITDSADIRLQNPENTGSPLGGQHVSSAVAFQTGPLLGDTQSKLCFSLDQAVTDAVLENVFHQLTVKVPAASSFKLTDLLNDAINPANLQAPSALPMAGTPLLTTDYYYIATGDDSTQWSVLEMDDGVVGAVAAQHGVDFVFVRNVSDPLVPDATSGGTAIASDVRDGWSSLVYNSFGIYSSFNGALVTWAMIAGASH